MDHLGEHLQALEHEVRTVQRRLRLWRSLMCAVLGLGLVSLLQPWGIDAQAPEDGSRGSLWQRVSALERTLRHVTSVTGEGGRPEVVITGANLRIVNGLRATATANGLGNLLVGYNERRDNGDDEHTGSHNVVVGQGHNFSSFGGLVVGRQNAIRGAFASVSGGFDNTASGDSASVSGGIFNQAKGPSAAVSGGFDNMASGNAAVVSGGDGNTASGNAAAVSGGHGNTANGHTAAISGGEANTARGFSAAVSGGRNRRAEWDFDWATASTEVVSGGHGDTASGRTAFSTKPRW
jgi:trimeric autotransporter adhesin